MQHTPNTETAVPDGDLSEVTISPTHVHHPAGHNVADTLDIAGHDEVDHDTALRESSLRVPR